MNPSLLYQYIADADPYSAKAICSKYGFSLADAGQTSDIAECLEQVVAQNGQQAFLEILALHPDKDLILEQYGSPSMGTATTEKKPCGCGGDHAKSNAVLDKYVPSESSTVMQQGNIFLIAAALLLAVAIITRP